MSPVDQALALELAHAEIRALRKREPHSVAQEVTRESIALIVDALPLIEARSPRRAHRLRVHLLRLEQAAK